MDQIADGYYWIQNSWGEYHVVLVSTKDNGRRWIQDCFLCAETLQDFLGHSSKTKLIPILSPAANEHTRATQTTET